MDFTSWYNPSQAYTVKHESYPRLPATWALIWTLFWPISWVVGMDLSYFRGCGHGFGPFWAYLGGGWTMIWGLFGLYLCCGHGLDHLGPIHPKNLISVSCVLCRVHSGHYGHQIGDHLYVACASIEIQIIPHPF